MVLNMWVEFLFWLSCFQGWFHICNVSTDGYHVKPWLYESVEDSYQPMDTAFLFRLCIYCTVSLNGGQFIGLNKSYALIFECGGMTLIMGRRELAMWENSGLISIGGSPSWSDPWTFSGNSHAPSEMCVGQGWPTQKSTKGSRFVGDTLFALLPLLLLLPLTGLE